MKNKNNITLVVACNDHFAIMLGALIKSIIHNHVSSEEIDLYIVDDGISAKSKNRIIECAGTHINLIWLEINDIFENVKLPVDNSTFPRNVYMRLFIPTFLPAEVKKAIYLDVDMINCVDISNLWNVSLDGHPIAGVRDRSAVISNEWGGIGNYKELNLNPETPYYNAGLIVYNNDLWRTNDISNKVVDVISNNLKFANFPDQYGLNVILANQWLELDFRWNCYSILDETKPFLIHFIGNKPIYKSYSDNKRYADYFFEYVRMTPWKNFTPHSTYRRYLNKAINKIRKKFHI